MPYKIHTKFHPSKPRPDRDLCDCHTSLGWPREGDAWPVEAGCDAGWLKESPYGKGKRVCGGAVSGPRLLPWGWQMSPETLHQWLWTGEGVWGRLRPPCMHPAHRREQLLATREPQPAHTLQRTAAQGSRMSTHREPPGVLGIWSMGTLQGEARERSPSHIPRGRQPAPEMVPPYLSQPPWEVDPSVPMEGRLGRHLARYV